MFVVRFSKNLINDVVTLVRSSTGRALREAGLALDREGSMRSGDIAYL
jgi:hypothetical protein